MKGSIYVVGIGPGSRDMMTNEAIKALEKSDIIIGYTVYVDLIKEYMPDKEYLSTPMKQEVARCKLCYEKALEGMTVSMVCSGDAGVYGMASPMYELMHEFPDIELIVVPGITAANSGAAVIGAPLSHDYCVISLSDLLTPWEVIERRIRAAVMGDFSMAIYNPSSHKRKDYLRKACDIMINEGASRDRICGYVRNINRDGMEYHVCTLNELRDEDVDMFTTVFVGNSKTTLVDGKMVTPRGYGIE